MYKNQFVKRKIQQNVYYLQEIINYFFQDYSKAEIADGI